nr:hypothetical protein [Tanacetum cinerariifolium]
DSRVDGLQCRQARQFFVRVGGEAALRLGYAFGVLGRDLAFGGIDLRIEHIALGLNELVGAGPRHAFELVIQGSERHAPRQVIAVAVQQAAQRGRWQVAAQLQRARRNHFTHIEQFKQHSAGLQGFVFDQRDGGVAHRAGQDQVHAALHHRVFPRDELHVLTGQRLVTVVGDGHAFVVAQREAGIEHLLARPQDQRVLGMIFTVDAERVEQGFHVDRQAELIVLLQNRFNQRVAFAGAAGIELQQAIAAGVQFALQTLAFVAGLGHQRLPIVFVTAFQLRQQARTERMLQRVTSRAGVEERVEGFVIPLEQALLRAGFQIRYVQLDDVFLADPVETTDTLFQQVGVGRQVEQHQMMRELEIAAFTADFRADQHLSAKLFVGEGVLEIHRGFGVSADDQHFHALEHLQGVDQPVDARVEAPPAFFFAALAMGLEADFRVQISVLANRQFQVFGRAGQRVRVQFALGESLHGGTGVAEQHAAGAVTVKQLADQARVGFGIASGDRGRENGSGRAGADARSGCPDPPLQRNQRQLRVFKRVAGIAFDKALGVEQRDLQVEAAAHFDQPLVLQTDFVRQQYAGRDTVSDLTGDVQLVRDRLCAHAAQSPQRGLQLTAGVFEGVVTQGEPRQRVDLPGEQTVGGQAELNEVRQLGLWQGHRLVLRVQAVIDQQAVDVVDFTDGHLPVFEMGDGVAWREAHSRQRRIAQGILAGVARGRIEHGQQATVLRQNGAQAQLGFASKLALESAQVDETAADSLITGDHYHAATADPTERGPRDFAAGPGQTYPGHPAGNALGQGQEESQEQTEKTLDDPFLHIGSRRLSANDAGVDLHQVLPANLRLTFAHQTEPGRGRSHVSRPRGNSRRHDGGAADGDLLRHRTVRPERLNPARETLRLL